MVTKIKEYKSGEKGILIFTHKELFLFNPTTFRSYFWRFIKEHYFLGMHWGSYHSDISPPAYIDFHMGGVGTLVFSEIPDKHFRTHLCSRNFLSYLPQDVSYKVKEWDILNISRPIDCKKILDFMNAIKNLYRNNKKVKVLLVCSAPAGYPQVKNGNLYYDLLNDYSRIFTDEEKNDFKIELRSDASYPFSFSKNEIENFYRRSKVFALFSDIEGESRVISEALLFGLPVVAWKGLRGGGLDYLNHTNSELFSDYSSAHIALEKALEKTGYEDISKNAIAHFYEKNSLLGFEDFLYTLYRDQNLSFNGLDIKESLDRALPGHLNLLSPEFTNPFTDDINSFGSLIKYMSSHTEIRKKSSRFKLLLLAKRLRDFF